MDPNSKKKIGLVGVPLGFGASQVGSELGVNAMRLSRIRETRRKETCHHHHTAPSHPTHADSQEQPTFHETCHASPTLCGDPSDKDGRTTRVGDASPSPERHARCRGA